MTKELTVPKPPLVVDPDKEFLKTFILPKGNSKVVPQTACTGKDAQLIIADSTNELSAIFVNLAVQIPDGISVIRSARHHRPILPIYLIYDGQPPLQEKELRPFGIQKALSKPVSYDQVINLITPSRLAFDADNVIAGSQMYKDEIDKELNFEDSDFSAIRANDFIAGSRSIFDVYVRIAPKKYLKILQSGDHFSSERIDNYLKKNVSHFYIRKEMQKHYVAYCDNLATRIVRSSQFAMDIKVSQSLNHGEEIFNYLQENGVSSENIKLATQFIHNVQDLVAQLNPGQQPQLKEFLEDVTSYEQGVGVAAIASLLFPALKITSTNPVESIGLSSLLHDIGLKKLDPALLSEDESQMTDQQKTVFRTHPKISADILYQIRDIKPVVIQAVSQHHERRTKKGFPDGIGTGSISIVAEIVGISDEYFHFLQKKKQGTLTNPRLYLENRIFKVFSSHLVAEFKKVFNLSDIMMISVAPDASTPDK